jgi:hypothetical protein
MKRKDRKPPLKDIPAQVNEPHSEEKDTRGQNNECKVTGKINVHGTIDTKFPPELVNEYRASETTKESREKVKLRLELLTFLSALGILFFTWSQMKIGRDNLALLRTQFALDQRPYISVEKPHFSNVYSGLIIDNPIPGLPLAVTVEYKNIGKSPALGVEIERFVYSGNTSMKELMAPRQRPKKTNQILPAQEAHVTTAASLRDERNNSGVDFTPDQLLPWDGSTPIIIFGNIYYGDSAGGKYCTEFAYRFLGNANQSGGWLDMSGANAADCKDTPPKEH